MAPLVPLLLILGVGGALALSSQSKGTSSGPSAGPTAPGGSAAQQVPSIYDPGMPLATQQAVTTALNSETDPAKLQAFAQSLLPEFPIASGLLNAKASQILAGQHTAPAVTPAVVTPATPAAPSIPVSVLPTAQNPMAIPGVFPNPGSTAVVATQTDPLNVRDQPSTSGSVIGQLQKGSTVTITGGPESGPGSSSGWAHVQQGNLQGWAALDFLHDGSGQAAANALNQAISLITPSSSGDGSFPTQAVVVTQSTPLNIRSQPNKSASIVGQAAKGSQVTITSAPVPGDGSQDGGWAPVRTPAGVTGFASMVFLALLPNAVTAGFAPPATTGAIVSDADLLEWASRLDSALQTGTCRASQEPITQRFQAAAHQRGIYTGSMTGFYDEPTRAALGKVLGKAPPPCVSRTAGFKQPNSYWDAQGA